MAKIISSDSGPIPPDRPVQPVACSQKTILVTPNPATRKERQANAKAKRNQEAFERRAANAHAPRKLSESKRTARRKLKRDTHYQAAQAVLLKKQAPKGLT
jgi:hypothetical protein